jgi:hypothetical protein
MEYKNNYSRRFKILCKEFNFFFSYKPQSLSTQAAPGDDLTPDYMNILGMIFSMCGLMMRVSFLRMQQLSSYKFITND